MQFETACRMHALSLVGRTVQWQLVNSIPFHTAVAIIACLQYMVRCSLKNNVYLSIRLLPFHGSELCFKSEKNGLGSSLEIDVQDGKKNLVTNAVLCIQAVVSWNAVAIFS
jgi:hypothetical protein